MISVNQIKYVLDIKKSNLSLYDIEDIIIDH